MEALKNVKMIEAARLEAGRLISTDPTLSEFPALKEKVISKSASLHFE